MAWINKPVTTTHGVAAYCWMLAEEVRASLHPLGVRVKGDLHLYADLAAATAKKEILDNIKIDVIAIAPLPTAALMSIIARGIWAAKCGRVNFSGLSVQDPETMPPVFVDLGLGYNDPPPEQPLVIEDPPLVPEFIPDPPDPTQP